MSEGIRRSVRRFVRSFVVVVECVCVIDETVDSRQRSRCARAQTWRRWKTDFNAAVHRGRLSRPGDATLL